MWYERALRGLTLALGPDHASTLDTVYNLANLLHSQVTEWNGMGMFFSILPSYSHTSTLMIRCIYA